MSKIYEDKENEQEQEKEKVSIGDSLKRLISVGVGAAFLTEDAIKGVIGDIPLSKDIISGLLSQAKKSKEDFIKSIREEVVKHLSSVDPKALLNEVLDDYEITVNAKFSFEKKIKPQEADKTKKSKQAAQDKEKS